MWKWQVSSPKRDQRLGFLERSKDRWKRKGQVFVSRFAELPSERDHCTPLDCHSDSWYLRKNSVEISLWDRAFTSAGLCENHRSWNQLEISPRSLEKKDIVGYWVLKHFYSLSQKNFWPRLCERSLHFSRCLSYPLDEDFVAFCSPRL